MSQAGSFADQGDMDDIMSEPGNGIDASSSSMTPEVAPCTPKFAGVYAHAAKAVLATPKKPVQVFPEASYHTP